MQNLLKAAGATQKQLGLVRLHEQTKKNLEQEIQVRIQSQGICVFFTDSSVVFSGTLVKNNVRIVALTEPLCVWAVNKISWNLY